MCLCVFVYVQGWRKGFQKSTRQRSKCEVNILKFPVKCDVYDGGAVEMEVEQTNFRGSIRSVVSESKLKSKAEKGGVK